MKRLLMIGLLLFVGCKGPQGDKGDTGAAGPGTVSVLAGTLTSDPQTMYDSRFNLQNSVTVMIGDSSGAYMEIPGFLPSEGVNSYYLMRSGQITLYNCYIYGLTKYNIVFVTKSAPAASMKARILG